MHDSYTLLLSYLRGVWHKRWYAIAIAWVFCGAGWAYVANLPDKYQSNARIYIDMDTMLSPLMKGLAVDMNLYQQIAVMQRTLLSRPNLEKVVLMTDMDLKIKSEEQKEKMFSRLRKTIRIGQQGRNLNLFRISYQDKDPGMAKRVVQAVLQIFVEGNIGASRKDMDSTRRFIEDQLRDYERQLNDSESRIAEFKRKNMGFLRGGGNFYSRLEKRRAAIAKTEAIIRQAESLNGELSAQIKKIPQFLHVARGDARDGVGPGSDGQLRIMQMEAAIDSLLTRFTEKHPDVVVARRRLAVLQRNFAKEQEEAREFSAPEEPSEAGPNTEKVYNPVYEKLKVQLVRAQAAMAALKSKLENQKLGTEKWLKLSNLVPQVESELKRLSRDHGLLKKNYTKLRSRKESAKMARELETKAQKVQFRIIDPPKVPIKPSGPKRALFMSTVLIAGIVGGIAFAFLLSQINTAISTVDALRSKFSFPVLGSITAITSLQERRRRIRELSGFAVMGASLLFAYLGLIAIENFGAQRIIDGVKELGII